jgi:hypothetical protein
METILISLSVGFIAGLFIGVISMAVYQMSQDVDKIINK